jgi:hypothetical protein
MKAYEENLGKMLAVWNTTDQAEQRALVEAALEANVHFVDPNHNLIGHEAFLKMVAEVQARLRGAVYSRASRIDMQHNHCRYHWAIHVSGAKVVDGFDMTEVNDAGRIVKVVGFFGLLEREEA